jgi:hypothetical protein
MNWNIGCAETWGARNQPIASGRNIFELEGTPCICPYTFYEFLIQREEGQASTRDGFARLDHNQVDYKPLKLATLQGRGVRRQHLPEARSLLRKPISLIALRHHQRHGQMQIAGLRVYRVGTLSLRVIGRRCLHFPDRTNN